jgi:hypothetical protein
MGKAPIETMVGREVHGTVDNVVYRQLYGKAVLARRPRPTLIPPTASQLNQRREFARAADFARTVFADPARKEAYRLLAERRGFPAGRLFAFIVRDWSRPPVIGVIDTSEYKGRIGDPIMVDVTDDGEVASVTMRLEKDGVLIEEGAAQNIGGNWRYAATVAVPAGEPLALTITAKDLPGHKSIEKLGVTPTS